MNLLRGFSHCLNENISRRNTLEHVLNNSFPRKKLNSYLNTLNSETSIVQVKEFKVEIFTYLNFYNYKIN